MDANTINTQEKSLGLGQTCRKPKVEIEPHAFCNRRCPFCGNSRIDRIKNHQQFDWGTYLKILQDMRDRHYEGTLCFARYCEPLACPNILDYVKTAREKLPELEIMIVTNGDYLNDRSIGELRDAGLSTLAISIYPWDTASQEVERLSRAMGLVPIETHRDSDAIQW